MKALLLLVKVTHSAMSACGSRAIRIVFLVGSLASELVNEDDVLEFDLTLQPVRPSDMALYSERVIHGAIYRARPDITAVCHHHSPALLPFCHTGLTLRVATQLGATIGKRLSLWDQQEEFGATTYLVVKEDEAVSLARYLGSHSVVLTNRHEATVVGSSIEGLVFRSIYNCWDAELQLRNLTYGTIDVFTEAEIRLATDYPRTALARAWHCWCSRPEKRSSH